MRISATIALEDAVSPALMSVVRATRQAIVSLQSLSGITEEQRGALGAATAALSAAEGELHRLASAMQTAVGPARQMSAAVRDVGQATEHASERARRAQDHMRGLGDDFASTGETILRTVGALWLLEKGMSIVSGAFRSAIERGLNFRIQMEQVRTTMTVMLGDAARANAYLSDLLNFARHTPFQFPDLAGVSRNLIAFGIEAEKTLPILNAIGDAVGAVGGGRETFLSIADAFGAIATMGQLSMEEVRRLQEHGIPALQIIANQLGVKATEAQKMISQGAIDAQTAIYLLVKGIEEGTDGLAGKTVAMAGMMKNVKQTWLGALDTMSTSIRTLGDATIGPFFEMIKQGILDAAAWITQLAERLRYVGERAAEIAAWIKDNWDSIGPVVLGVAMFFGVYTAAVLMAKAATVGLNAVLSFLAANPVVLVISGIIAIITVLVTLWRTNDQFAAALYRAWNKNVAFFWTVVEGIASAFEWMAQYVGKIFDTVINGIIKGINKVLELVNRVTGSSYKIEAEFSMGNVAKGMKEYAQIQNHLAEQRASDQGVKEFIAARQAARAAQAKTPTKPPMPNVSPELLKPSGLSTALSQIGKVDKVGSVGKIEQPVEISSEDLKTIRELAEINAINNFVTLTPSVSIVTGDIHEKADVDDLIRRIEDYLARELAVSTRRVYGLG